MRERMLFLSAQNQTAEDLEGEMRTREYSRDFAWEI